MRNLYQYSEIYSELTTRHHQHDGWQVESNIVGGIETNHFFFLNIQIEGNKGLFCEIPPHPHRNRSLFRNQVLGRYDRKAPLVSILHYFQILSQSKLKTNMMTSFLFSRNFYLYIWINKSWKFNKNMLSILRAFYIFGGFPFNENKQCKQAKNWELSSLFY